MGLFGASLVAASALSRLATDATLATLATAAVGTVVVALLRRRPPLAVVLGVVVVAGSALFIGLHASTRSGAPSAGALQALRHSLRAARPVLAAFHLPLAQLAGITALCALFGGLVAVGGRALGIRAPGLSLVPAAAILLWSAVLLPTTGVALAGLVLAGCGFLVLAGHRVPDVGASAGVAGISLALAALTLGWSSVAGSNVASPGGRVTPAVAPSALSLATNLTGVETRDADVVLFRVTSRVPTYWQVTTLTTFVGDQWVPDPETDALLRGAAPVPTAAAPGHGQLFTAGVTLTGYSGRLLPAPPDTVSVSGGASPVVTSSGVVASVPVHAGTSYTASAIVPSPVADAPSNTPAPGAYTSLPPIPPVVASLASSITAGQDTPLDKAEALTDFFRSGRFHYKVVASQPVGADPLVAFLTQTRTGSCEQFAGAFTVLARASGLATRVAVGFTPGRPSNGATLVRGGDAHAWPEVLIDGRWVSFEPTPQLPSGELSPPGVLGPAGLGHPNPTGPGTQPSVSIPVVTQPPPTRPPSTVPVTVASAGFNFDVLWIALLIVSALSAVLIFLLRRSRRTPIDRLVVAWTSVDRALARRGLARPEWRTPIGHVTALSKLLQTEQGQAALADLTAVANLLQNVAYGPYELLPADVQWAVGAARRARKAILAGAVAAAAGYDPGLSSRPHEFTGGKAGGGEPGDSAR
jgi:transglutaminase-like putative cysteine protease